MAHNVNSNPLNYSFNHDQNPLNSSLNRPNVTSNYKNSPNLQKSILRRREMLKNTSLTFSSEDPFEILVDLCKKGDYTYNISYDRFQNGVLAKCVWSYKNVNPVTVVKFIKNPTDSSTIKKIMSAHVLSEMNLYSERDEEDEFNDNINGLVLNANNFVNSMYTNASPNTNPVTLLLRSPSEQSLSKETVDEKCQNSHECQNLHESDEVDPSVIYDINLKKMNFIEQYWNATTPRGDSTLKENVSVPKDEGSSINGESSKNTSSTIQKYKIDNPLIDLSVGEQKYFTHRFQDNELIKEKVDLILQDNFELVNDGTCDKTFLITKLNKEREKKELFVLSSEYRSWHMLKNLTNVGDFADLFTKDIEQ